MAVFLVLIGKINLEDAYFVETLGAGEWTRKLSSISNQIAYQKSRLSKDGEELI